jgi:DUF177 domain-containing protein
LILFLTGSGSIDNIRRLMSSDPSQSINPLRLAKSRERIKGSLVLDSLERLKAVLLENTGKLEYSLSFDFDESGTCIVESAIDSQLILECQRCLKPVVIEIHRISLLGVINDKNEIDALAKEYEPLQLDEENITVEELLEDELLLSIPISPLHAENECTGQEILDQVNADAKLQPFAALAALKKK